LVLASIQLRYFQLPLLNIGGAKFNKPKSFSGTRADLETFIFSCGLHFKRGQFSDEDKQDFFATYLEGDALLWYLNTVERDQMNFPSYKEFLSFFRANYGIDRTTQEEMAVADLSRHKQGDRMSVRKYADEFRNSLP